jgi:hypothetical protein
MTTTSEAPADTATDALGLYRLCLEAEQSDLNGAPTVRLSLLVDAVRGTVTGQGLLTPAEYVFKDPPVEPVAIDKITGTIHKTPSGPVGVTQVLSLRGESVVTLPPPAIGSFLVPFTATFAMDDHSVGHGGWSGAFGKVEDATIHSIACTA